MNAQARPIPISSDPAHLGRPRATEYHLYCQYPGAVLPQVKAELNSLETALDVLAAVNAGRVGDETYFLVKVTFEVVS